MASISIIHPFRLWSINAGFNRFLRFFLIWISYQQYADSFIKWSLLCVIYMITSRSMWIMPLDLIRHSKYVNLKNRYRFSTWFPSSGPNIADLTVESEACIQMLQWKWCTILAFSIEQILMSIIVHFCIFVPKNKNKNWKQFFIMRFA